MSKITLIFPHQLFADHPALHLDRDVLLLEDELFFSHFNFHKQKLAFHRASMKAYEAKLKTEKYKVTYLDAIHTKSKLEKLFGDLGKKGVKEVHLCDPVDYLANRRLHRYANHHKIKLNIYPSPNFFDTSSYGKEYFGGKKKFHLTEYYIAQRKRYQILVEEEKATGGKWTFDIENRKKIPANVPLPRYQWGKEDVHYSEATVYVNKHFKNNIGELNEIRYPITHHQAQIWLDEFMQNRFMNYGIYQDAIVEEDGFLFHSIITPMLNTGLLDPQTIVQKALEAGTRYHIPMNSLEGFIRQIVGWREYIRHIYNLRGVQQRTTNYFQHDRKIPESFYTGSTGIKPVDIAIKRVLKSGYTHHIERLMVLGNFMLLCEFDPDEVYRWFMELFIDSYDWVMVPNVYGMSQFADGGMMSTKPYISGSNYILKMSNYKKGGWSDSEAALWDALYWRFIDKHKAFFLKNPRMSMMVRQLEKMDKNRYDTLLQTAEKYLNSLQ